MYFFSCFLQKLKLLRNLEENKLHITTNLLSFHYIIVAISGTTQEGFL